MLIISHKNDIDGMGGVVLLKLVYKDVDYILCEDCNINQIFINAIKNGGLNNYKKIFVTDLHINDIVATIINNSNLKDKVIVFDHNESAKYLDKYDFANIIIQKDGKYCCSTTLLYDYLKSKEAIQSTQAIDSFCEATRLYDIGQWKLDSLNQTPRNLSLLYEIFGPIKYIDVMLEKLQKHNTFFFSDSENTAICNKKKLIHQKVTSYIANMRIKNINGYRTGILFIAYEYRNEIAQCLRKNNTMRLDQVILVALDNRSISFRNINPDINVRPLAEALGGKGHYGAAGCYITKNNIDKVSQLVL